MAYANDYNLIGAGYNGDNFVSLERTPQGMNRVLDLDSLTQEDETDIDFVNGLYRSENADYFLGSWMIKSVSDILLHFMGLPTPVCSDSKEYEKLLGDTYTKNTTKLYNLLKYTGLYGQAFVEIGYNQKKKQIVLHPLTRKKVIEVRYENYNDPNDITYARIRTTVDKYEDESDEIHLNDIPEDDKKQVHYDKIYWKENNSDYVDFINGTKPKDKDSKTPDEFLFKYKVLKVEDGKASVHLKESINPWQCVPVVEFNQNRLEGDRNGYSDANGLIKLTGVYHQILERAIDANMYNGQPTIVFSGLDDPNSFIKEMYGEVESGGAYVEGTYNLMGGYYLKGKADVDYLQVDDTVSNAKSLLELIFYIMVQLSGVPEWALGAHINGTYASTKMQSSPLIQRINSKRLDVNDAFLEMNDKIGLIVSSNGSELKYDNQNTSLYWNEALPDESMDLQTKLSMAKEANLITDETYMRLLNLVSDYQKEISGSKKQNEAKMQLAAQYADVDPSEIMKSVSSKMSISDDEEDNLELNGEMVDVFSDMMRVLVSSGG